VADRCRELDILGHGEHFTGRPAARCPWCAR
jgi:hypothetical protein